MVIRPAPVNAGITFKRVDLDPVITFPARAEGVGDTRLCTTLVQNGQRISTIEHLMSAFAALGVDNAIVELTAGEVPVMDGSASPFVYLLQSVGLVEQAEPKRFIRILAPIMIEEGDKWARLDPFEGFKITCSIAYDHPAIPKTVQMASCDFAVDSYVETISRARTYGFLRDYEWLRTQNLALGGSLDNAVVLDEYKVINEGGLRYEDEFVRHKMLDAIGDLYLAGAPILGAFSGHKTGHHLNNLIVRKLLAETAAWEWTTVSVEGPTAAILPHLDGLVPASI